MYVYKLSIIYSHFSAFCERNNNISGFLINQVLDLLIFVFQLHFLTIIIIDLSLLLHKVWESDVL